MLFLILIAAREFCVIGGSSLCDFLASIIFVACKKVSFAT